MKTVFSILSVGAVLLACGCAQNESKAPEALAVTEIPAAIQKAFGANGESAQTASNLVVAVQTGNNADALALTDTLLDSPKLSNEQRGTAVRCQLALTQAIQNAAEQGDQLAAAEIKYRRETK